MRKTLIVTDVTRMRSPYVCVGCVDELGKNIRPVLNYGQLKEEWLYEDGMVIIRPFAKIALELVRSKPRPPHTEDWVMLPEVKAFKGQISEAAKLHLLTQILDPDVESIFGAEIQHGPGYHIKENEGKRSLGTVRAAKINFVRYEKNEGVWGYRIGFTDEGGGFFSLAVTDLAFHSYLDEIRINRGLDGDQIGAIVAECLREKVMYLRIGLTRPTWKEHPHCCFLQINGVYTFPDYLEGRCFADF
jgi:hypothetical protein